MQKISNGKTELQFIFLTLTILMIIVIFLESSLRSKSVKNNLVPYLGSSHRQLEIQLARIKNFSESEKVFDCIFIGSSMVWLGINPVEFSKSYQGSTGTELTCFNFGISAMPAAAAGTLTEILVKEFQPKIILFGTSARDYAIPVDAQDSRVILETPWIRYQLGDFSFDGWFYTNSALFGHLRNFNRLLQFDKTVFRDIGINDYDRTGFLPKMGKAPDETEQTVNEDLKNWLANSHVLHENVDGVNKIAQLNDQNITVIFFQTPVSNDYYHYLDLSLMDFNQYLESVTTISSEYNIPFIQVHKPDIIPEDGWWNENHLNIKGANAFSWWLGQQVGSSLLND